ncbi:ankyrin repeat domain-containing protein [Spirosoma gilvum]
MKNSDSTDPVFRETVEAIDAGDITNLHRLLESHPDLAGQRSDVPAEGYFSHPYLLWFIADNPIRNGTLPANSVDVARLLIQAIREHASESFQHQIDYTLGLVVTGRIPRTCGVQLDLMDVLINAGATPGQAHGALAHGNLDAARHLIKRGGELTLLTAICLNLGEDAQRLAHMSTVTDRQIALIGSAFYGKADWLAFLIRLGANVNGYIEPSSGFHSHATALHQAVYAGSLDAVNVLVEAGARLDLEDRIYHGTPLGWAIHMQTEDQDERAKHTYAEIEAYLRNRMDA